MRTFIWVDVPLHHRTLEIGCAASVWHCATLAVGSLRPFPRSWDLGWWTKGDCFSGLKIKESKSISFINMGMWRWLVYCELRDLWTESLVKCREGLASLQRPFCTTVFVKSFKFLLSFDFLKHVDILFIRRHNQAKGSHNVTSRDNSMCHVCLSFLKTWMCVCMIMT